MSKQYLMIETKDQRKFFTYRRHLPQLIEFSKTFNAEISVVRTDEEPLDMLSLAENLCSDNYEIHKPSFEIVEIKVGQKRSKKKLTHNAKIIRKFIQRELLAGKPVRLCGLMKRFKRYGLTKPTFCNHFTAIRKELASQGFLIEKTGQGEYMRKKNPAQGRA